MQDNVLTALIEMRPCSDKKTGKEEVLVWQEEGQQLAERGAAVDVVKISPTGFGMICMERPPTRSTRGTGDSSKAWAEWLAGCQHWNILQHARKALR